MHNLVTIREISATVAALLIATIATWLPTATPEAKAQTLAVNMIDHSLKADRFPTPLKGAACSTLGWPHYEQGCQFDQRRDADNIRTVRIIALR
jgi:hypothetical protein